MWALDLDLSLLLRQRRTVGDPRSPGLQNESNGAYRTEGSQQNTWPTVGVPNAPLPVTSFYLHSCR